MYLLRFLTKKPIYLRNGYYETDSGLNNLHLHRYLLKSFLYYNYDIIAYLIGQKRWILRLVCIN